MRRRDLLALLPLTVPLPLFGADWLRFRGTNGAGVAEGPLPPTSFTDAKNLLWKVPVPGQGVSSPVIVKGKVLLQSATDEKRMLLCLDAATGKTLWIKDLPGQKAHTHKKNSLASGTPASDGEQAYVISWDGAAIALHAFDLSGNEKWTAPIGQFESQHGPGHSPAVFGGKVFVNFDQDGAAAVLAFDAKTGKRAWVDTRKPERACYSTPLVLEHPGRPPALVVASTHEVTGYDPDTGKKLWAYPVGWGGGKGALRSVGSPLAAGTLVTAQYGDGGGTRRMIALDVSAGAPVLAWELRKDTPYVPCPVALGDHLYWVTDPNGGSLACCADRKTGKNVWAERVFTKTVTASPILVGDTLVAVSEDGVVAAIKAAPEFEPPTLSKLGEGCYASPAVADGKLYIRGTNHLFCVGKK